MILRTLAGVLLSISCGGVAFAAAGPWTAILDPARATDWSTAGVTGGIPSNRTQCGSTINAYTGSAATVNNAISTCTAGHYVLLGSGVFNLSSTIVMKDNVTLRGQGMATILNFTNSGGSNFYWGSTLIAVQGSGFSSSGDGSAPGQGGVPSSTIRNWTGTNGQQGVYTQGATVVNLDSTPSGLTVGGTLTLWQADINDGSLPISGYFVSDKNGGSNNISWQGSSGSQNSGQQQRVKVTNISGNTVTITPGLYRPTGTWNSSASPKAGWQSGVATGVGLEDFRIQRTMATQFVIAFNAAADSWVEGVGIIGGTGGGTGGGDNGIQIIDSRNITIRSNWWNPYWGGGIYTTTSYGISLAHCSGCLIENNVFNQVESPIMLNMGTTGTVVAYNYENYAAGKEGGLQSHQEGPAMNLYEGNSSTKFWADVFHGNTALNTFFRNHFYGGQGLDLWAYHRWYNLIGNVINASVYQSLYTDATKYSRWDGVAFRLGYASQNKNGGVELGDVRPDPVVISSLMRWGNYVTTGGTRFLASEIPTNDPVFPTSVPSSQTLPASFYLSDKPNWWPPAKPWPAIGPDVIGGNMTGYAGHAYTTPAEDCYTASGGTIASFNPATCYAVGGIGPSAPTNLRIIR